MAVSTLALSFPKVVLIPVKGDPEFLKAPLQGTPNADLCQVAQCGKYLGVFSGLGGREKSWSDVSSKFFKRVRYFAKAVPFFHMLAMSVLSFVAQYKLTNSPRFALPHHVLTHLKSLGQPFEFIDVQQYCKAVQCRGALQTPFFHEAAELLEDTMANIHSRCCAQDSGTVHYRVV